MLFSLPLINATPSLGKVHLAKGIEMGKRPDLTGGGLVRSSGGLTLIKSLRKADIHFKSDERILGDSDFVDKALKSTNELLQRRYALKAEGWILDKLAEKTAAICGLDPEQIFMPSKQPIQVKARSLFCYRAVGELGVATTKSAELLKITQSAVSICVRRGEQIVQIPTCGPCCITAEPVAVIVQRAGLADIKFLIF
jgi:putative transposase